MAPQPLFIRGWKQLSAYLYKGICPKLSTNSFYSNERYK